jgi:hypothetical protein
MEPGEEELIRVTIGTLARGLQLLTNAVQGVTSVVISRGLDETALAVLNEVDKELRTLDETLVRVAEAFPPGDVDSGNGKPL